jgi:hypothetical protein
LIDGRRENYFATSSGQEKACIAQEVVLTVNETGRFLEYDKELRAWVTVGEEVARKKVSQALQYRQRCWVKEHSKESDPQESLTPETNLTGWVSGDEVLFRGQGDVKLCLPDTGVFAPKQFHGSIDPVFSEVSGQVSSINEEQPIIGDDEILSALGHLLPPPRKPSKTIQGLYQESLNDSSSTIYEPIKDNEDEHLVPEEDLAIAIGHLLPYTPS